LCEEGGEEKLERARKCAREERSRHRAVDIEVHLLLWKKKASPTLFFMWMPRGKGKTERVRGLLRLHSLVVLQK
jgi:hypothetical protein